MGFKDVFLFWSILFTLATNEALGLRATTYGGQPVVIHLPDRPDCIAAKHVDDVNASAPATVLAFCVQYSRSILGKEKMT